MSYSRWGSRGSGYWYTFWCVQPKGKKETRDNAVFEICTLANFTAKQLRNNMDKCIKKVQKLDESADNGKFMELRVYMNEFLNDVNCEYN
jgi:hypothetical protein